MQQIDCILLVDDDEITNFVNESLINDLAAAQEVLVTTSGQQALNVIKQRSRSNSCLPSLILLDMNMPGMNGLEFLQAYERLEESLRQSVIIVMLTSSNNPTDVAKIERSNLADMLNKPLTEVKLKHILKKYFS
ncbi:response regulator [Tunicatimonas pelagia]|uniref:response regulator n=1 Tax=Tunicatimonas pelagia TaxID=931531 RepID=UPI0026664EBA|nr:response regulator [Tunicatimonas pelagia]WKN45215.1 response regulator [Tunicatimonas pelagia]